MPGFLVNSKSTVICAHGGISQPVIANPRVKVAGLPVVTQGAPSLVTGCKNLLPPNGIGPCMLGTWITGSARVKVMGMPVLLQDSQAVCSPTGTALTVVTTQLRVKAI
jgi:uncharacterized Zn-binding protein involved in type VI secretion